MKTKLYAVIWTEKAKVDYGIPKKDHGIVPIEQDIVKFNVAKSKIGRPKMRWATVYPVFNTYEEAEAYRNENIDWKTVEFNF